jgi:hypothetical protein
MLEEQPSGFYLVDVRMARNEEPIFGQFANDYEQGVVSFG